MKKIITISIISLLIICGCGVTAINIDSSKEHTSIMQLQSYLFQFTSKPHILERDGFVTIEINEMTSHLLEPNKPILPIFVKTYELPFGSKNIKVTCNPKEINAMFLTKKVMLAYITPFSKISEIKTIIKDNSIYNSTIFYPTTWYTFDIGSGLNTEGTKVIFIKIICYPVRYSPGNNILEYTTSFDVTLTYEAPPLLPAQTNDTFDLVIIAPEIFQSRLQPLVDFKNTKSMKTTFKSVEAIFSEYTGADPPEQIKYFIKDAYDKWNIQYVLLVGGLKSHIFANDKDTQSAGWKAWWVPVRYVNIPQGDDEGCLSDLYYGCLYNATGCFDSWDSNRDGVYASWSESSVKNDIFDMYPEVYVGRLPVTTKKEVEHIVQKIITYENSSPAAKPWYKNFIGIGGKTFDYYEGIPDGEYLCNLAYNYTKNIIPDLDLIPVYSTNKNTSGFVPIVKDIQKALSQGAGYVIFQGHGNPFVWDTIWFDGTYPSDWCGGITLYNFLKLSNTEKLPIIVVGGCHNGMYNVSLLKTMRDKTGVQYFCYGLPIPMCFSWGLVVKYPGGAIASTGCTGYGMAYQGNPVSLSAELESNFFYQVGNGSTNLGQAHSGAIQKFLLEEEIHQAEAFVITNWALFGDPSLRLGGYS